MKEFKYFAVLLTIERKMEHEINRPIGAASAVMQTLYRTTGGEEGAESEGKILKSTF